MNALNLSPDAVPLVALIAVVLVIGITVNILNLKRSRAKKGHSYKRAPVHQRITTDEWHHVTRKDLDQFHFPDGD